MKGMRRWIVAGLLALAGTVLHAQPVSFADLARHEQYKDVRISPDGKYLAATAVVKGQTAASSYKSAMLENGIRTQVPPFIEAGTKVIVSTDDGSYVKRAE